MTCTFNHMIVAARDRVASAAFYRHVLEAGAGCTSSTRPVTSSR